MQFLYCFFGICSVHMSSFWCFVSSLQHWPPRSVPTCSLTSCVGAGAKCSPPGSGSGDWARWLKHWHRDSDEWRVLVTARCGVIIRPHSDAEYWHNYTRELWLDARPVKAKDIVLVKRVLWGNTFIFCGNLINIITRQKVIQLWQKQSDIKPRPTLLYQ